MDDGMKSYFQTNRELGRVNRENRQQEMMAGNRFGQRRAVMNGLVPPGGDPNFVRPVQAAPERERAERPENMAPSSGGK